MRDTIDEGDFYRLGRLSLEIECDSKTIINSQASICLVKTSLESLASKADAFLHTNEHSRYLKYEYTLRKYNFLLGRFAAKKALTNLFNLEKKDAPKYNIIKGLLGEPLLETNNAQISIAHTKSFGVSIASKNFINFGIDIEYIKDLQKFSLDFYTNNEIQIFKSITPRENEREIKSYIWSAKEALVKYLKTGYTVPFEILEIKSAKYSNDMFVISFKNFHALSVLAIKVDQIILAICSLKIVSLSLKDLKLFLTQRWIPVFS